MTARRLKIYCAYFLALMGCVIGLFFLTYPSPVRQHDFLLDQAVAAFADGNTVGAEQAAIKAIRKNPAQRESWIFLEQVYRHSGRYYAAERARTVIAALEGMSDPAPPAYALPAALRLTLLQDPDVAAQP